MNRSTEFEVAAKSDRQVVEASYFTLYGEQIGQRLGRVVVTAVTCIDNRHVTLHRGNQRSTFLRVTHCDNVGISTYNRNRVRNAFALCRRA